MRADVLKKSLIVLIALAGILFLLIYPKAYVIRGSAGGTLYWKADEAFLFLGENAYGARMSYSRYALEPFLVGMGVVHPTEAVTCSKIAVIRVTDKDLQNFETDLYRYTEDAGCSFKYQFFRGQIYAVSWPELWRWSGTRFETTTPEEYGAYAEALANGTTVSQRPWEFDNIDGWSMRILNETPHEHQLVLNGQPVTIIFHGETWPPAPVSVDLTRPGQPPQTIWSFDGRPHRVSKAEYERTFEKH